MTKFDSRLRQQCSKLKIIVVGVLGLAPRHTEINAGTGMCVHIPFRLNPIASLAWLGKQLPCPLQISENQSEVLHLFRWYTHTLAARCWSCSWSTGRAELRFSKVVQCRHDRFCFLHADFHHVVLVVLFWSLWPN